MKKFEILRELPKCDTEMQSEQMLLEKWCQQTCRVATNLQFVKKCGICKHNKAKNNKTSMPISNNQL